MKRLGYLTPGILAALATLGTVVLLLATRGGGMFSPGPLSARSRPGVTLGGVRSHAEAAGQCSACHAPPWSRETMATRCLQCHTDIGQQLDAHRGLHGKLSEGRHCRSCHSDHHGADASLVSLDHFDHGTTDFLLTGKHQTLACQACHTGNAFHGTPQTCIGCHAEPTVHRGQFGTGCAGCHTTDTWKGSTFKHTFPINHGSRRSGKNTCATCHTQAGDFHQYTCYNCHAHDPDRVARKHHRLSEAELQNCVRCHATGREHERGRGREGRRRRERERW